jgi:uncharacterized protein YggE
MIRQVKAFSIVLVAALALSVLAGCAASPAAAQDPTPEGTPRTITVTGTGVAYGSPDVATATVGVQTRNTDPGQAMEQNTERMEAVIAAVRALGIAANDIQTTNFSIYAQQDYDPATGQPRETITYVVENSINITVRDVAKLGDVLSGAVEAGANSIYGVSFSVADPDALEAQAREQAFADARARADQLAELAGVSIDTVLNVSETLGSVPQPIYGARDMAVGMGGAAAVPVQTGQIQVNLSVNVTYIIK